MSRDTIRRAAATVRGWFSQKTRAYIYRVLAGAGLVAVFYGLLTKEEAAIWGGFLTTVLNVLPTANTSTKRGEDGAGELGSIVTLLVVAILVLVLLALLGVGVDLR